MITLDLLENKLIVLDSSQELTPSHKSQLFFWKFIKSQDGKTHELLFDKDSVSDQALVLKLVEFIKAEEIEYVQSPTLQEFLVSVTEDLILFDKIRSAGQAYKDGKFDEEELLDLTKFIKAKIPRKLKPHQYKAAYHHYIVKNCANFSVPGSGKTTVVLTIYEKLRSESEVNILFVIGPAACFGPWRYEFEATLGRQPRYKILAGGEKSSRKLEYYSPISKVSELYLTTFQSLINDQEEVKRFFKQQGLNVFLVVDEAHYIKQIDGTWANAVLSLSAYSKFRCILTGTPFPKSYTDVFNLFDFIWPSSKVIDAETKTAILLNDKKDKIEAIKKPLKDKIGPFFYRVRKSELGLIPPNFHPPFKLEMNKLEKKIYLAIEDKIKDYARQDYLKNIDLIMKLIRGRIIRLRQCTSYARLLSTAVENYDEKLLDDDSNLGHLIYNYDNLEIPAKLEYLISLIANFHSDNQKVVIWAHFIKTLELITKHLNKEGYYSKLIYGKTPIENESVEEEETRERIRNEFVDPDSGLDVLVANPAACAESISLHKTCFHSIYYDLSYNCAQYLQSLDRIHRVGGSELNQANYYFLQYENTIEEDIKINLDRKAQKMYDIIEQDYTIYTLDMYEDDAEIEAYKRLFTR